MERTWKFRRWAVFTSLAVCDVVILYLTIFGEDTRLNQDIANAAFLLVAAIVNGFVFGAAWDDRNKGMEAVQMKQNPGPTNDPPLG